MSSIEHTGPIRPTKKYEDTDNTGTVIEDFWEYHESGEEVETVKPIQLIIDLVKQATANVFIYTPMIMDGELIREIEYGPESRSFYAITRSVEKHSAIKNIIMRENPGMASTMVLVDVKTKNAAGLWFPGNMAVESAPFVLPLTQDQVREAHAHFSHYFWTAKGEELFHGKTRQVKPCHPTPQEISPVLKNSMRICAEGVESLVKDGIVEMWIPSNSAETITKYHPASQTLRVEITDDLKDRIYLDTIDSEVYGCKVRPPAYIKTGSSSLVGDNDLGFMLTKPQEKMLNTAYKAWPFQYFKKKTIGEIKTEKILTGAWGKTDPVPIKETLPITEQNVNADNIDEWLLAEKKPIFTNKTILAKTVRHEWEIEPPYLKKDAKRHLLYKNWDEFSNRLKKEAESTIKELDENLDRAGNPLDKLLALKDKGRWESWKKELEGTISLDWGRNYDRNNLVKAVERLYEIKRNIEQEKQTAKKNEEKEEASILEELKKERISKRKQKKIDKAKRKHGAQNPDPKKFEDDGEHSPLVEVLLDEDGLNNLKSRIPNAPLPSIGTLYESNSRNYLCIKNVEEIEAARKILANYKPVATIAVER